MHSFATAVLLGGAVLTAHVGATPIAASPVNDAEFPVSTPSFLSTIGLDDGSESNITARDIRGRLPVSAHLMEHKFQPVTDFDKDGCYYTSAIDPEGNINNGLGPANGVPPNCLRATCRDNNRLENNNVYSRKRCNNGWCAIMYEYYFEKDQVICGSWGAGHRHDWENIVVFIKDDKVKRVAPSCHGKYKGATNSPRMLDGTRAKVVYHKDGGETHCWRMAVEKDDNIENFTGRWFLGNLVGWNNFPSVGLRDKLVKNGPGPKPNFEEGEFVSHLEGAAGNDVPGFNPRVDG